MPKIAHNVPPLIGLLALHELWRSIKKLPSPDEVSESYYNEALSASLIDAGILPKKGNDSFTASFRSKPLDADYKKASGMDIKKLDGIAEIVIDEMQLRQPFSLPEKMTSPWEAFSTVIFPTTSEFADLAERKYLKYLSTEDAKRVTEHLAAKMAEHGLIQGSTVYYTIYLWSNASMQVRCGVMSIDPVKQSATCSYFNSENLNYSLKGTLKSDKPYHHEHNILHLDLHELNAQNVNVRATFYLTVSDKRLAGHDMIQGFINATSHEGGEPYCGEVILERRSSFVDAYSRVTNPATRNKLYCLEVLNRRIDSDRSVSSPKDLRTYKLAKNLEALEGFYFMGFITQLGSLRGDHVLSTAICHLRSDGIAEIKVNNEDDHFFAYVDQAIMRDDKFICMRYFLSNPADNYDVEYRLEVFRDYDAGGIIRGMKGVWQGYFNGTVYHDNMVMLKINYEPRDENDKSDTVIIEGQKIEIRPMSSIADAVALCDSRAIPINSKKLNDIEKIAIHMLIGQDKKDEARISARLQLLG